MIASSRSFPESRSHVDDPGQQQARPHRILSGFAALIPLCGCAFSIPAIILGVIGIIQAGKLNGEGKVHAIVAIVLGVGSMVVYGLLNLLVLVASANS